MQIRGSLVRAVEARGRLFAYARASMRLRALVLTARKLVRLIHALLTQNVPYAVRSQTRSKSVGGEPTP